MLGIPLPGVVSTLVARPLGHLGTAAVRWGMAGLAERRPSDTPTDSPTDTPPDTHRPPDEPDELVGVQAAS